MYIQTSSCSINGNNFSLSSMSSADSCVCKPADAIGDEIDILESDEAVNWVRKMCFVTFETLN